MVGRGDAEENRKKAKQSGFDFPVVVQRKWELSKQYGIFATPVAFLIDEEGIIARDVATGVDAILELAQQALLTSHESQVRGPSLSSKEHVMSNQRGVNHAGA
jgi:alkyl hydroperoxide reductase subunit AhpC